MLRRSQRKKSMESPSPTPKSRRASRRLSREISETVGEKDDSNIFMETEKLEQQLDKVDEVEKCNNDTAKSINKIYLQKSGSEENSPHSPKSDSTINHDKEENNLASEESHVAQQQLKAEIEKCLTTDAKSISSFSPQTAGENKLDVLEIQAEEHAEEKLQSNDLSKPNEDSGKDSFDKLESDAIYNKLDVDDHEKEQTVALEESQVAQQLKAEIEKCLATYANSISSFSPHTAGENKLNVLEIQAEEHAEEKLQSNDLSKPNEDSGKDSFDKLESDAIYNKSDVDDHEKEQTVALEESQVAQQLKAEIEKCLATYANSISSFSPHTAGENKLNVLEIQAEEHAEEKLQSNDLSKPNEESGKDSFDKLESDAIYNKSDVDDHEKEQTVALEESQVAQQLKAEIEKCLTTYANSISPFSPHTAGENKLDVLEIQAEEHAEEKLQSNDLSKPNEESGKDSFDKLESDAITNKLDVDDHEKEQTVALEESQVAQQLKAEKEKCLTTYAKSISSFSPHTAGENKLNVLEIQAEEHAEEKLQSNDLSKPNEESGKDSFDKLESDAIYNKSDVDDHEKEQTVALEESQVAQQLKAEIEKCLTTYANSISSFSPHTAGENKLNVLEIQAEEHAEEKLQSNDLVKPNEESRKDSFDKLESDAIYNKSYVDDHEKEQNVALEESQVAQQLKAEKEKCLTTYAKSISSFSPHTAGENKLDVLEIQAEEHAEEKLQSNDLSKPNEESGKLESDAIYNKSDVDDHEKEQNVALEESQVAQQLKAEKEKCLTTDAKSISSFSPQTAGENKLDVLEIQAEGHHGEKLQSNDLSKPNEESGKDSFDKSQSDAITNKSDVAPKESANKVTPPLTGNSVTINFEKKSRKRKWMTKKTVEAKVPIVSISSDSLKHLFANVPPGTLVNIDLESSTDAEEIPSEREEGERTPTPEKEALRFSPINPDKIQENQSDTNLISGSVTDAINEQHSPSPPHNKSSNILYITNLVRPFTALQLKVLLARTGKIIEESFWLDRIKSKCFVQYETEDEAVETRHALHGVRWPVSNPKYLNVDFGLKADMDRAIQSTKDELSNFEHENNDDNLIIGTGWHEEMNGEDKKNSRPVREWDVGKKENFEKEKGRDTHKRHSREVDVPGTKESERSLSPVRKLNKKENDPPITLLDDLFRKTKVPHYIYWLPLTPEQIAEKKALGQKRLEEHKQRVKQREIEKEKVREKDRSRSRSRNRLEEHKQRGKQRYIEKEKGREKDRTRSRSRNRLEEKKQRGNQREKEKGREKDRTRSRSRNRLEEHKQRGKQRDIEKEKGREKDRTRSRSRNRLEEHKQRGKQREIEKEKGREKDRTRSRSRNRLEEHKQRGKQREIEKEKGREKDRTRSRSRNRREEHKQRGNQREIEKEKGREKDRTRSRSRNRLEEHKQRGKQREIKKEKGREKDRTRSRSRNRLEEHKQRGNQREKEKGREKDRTRSRSRDRLEEQKQRDKQREIKKEKGR